MKKAMNIMILAALLTGCAANAKEEKNVIRSATTTTATTTTTAAVTTAVTTTKTVQTSTSVTTTAETTTTSVSAVSAASKTTTGKRTATQTPQTCIVYETEYAEVVQQDLDTQQEPAITTAATTTAPSVTASTAVPTALPTVEWSENMAIWRKLCESQQLTGSEQDIIRSEIQDYALRIFNGKKDIHVSFGTDEYDISFERPLELEANNEMVTMDNAHMDAYCDPNCAGLIKCAADEQDIYDIVSGQRQSCLHIIDHGLFNRWEIFSINNALKYASHIEFNIGFDEDMTLWFLTQD